LNCKYCKGITDVSPLFGLSYLTINRL